MIGIGADLNHNLSEKLAWLCICYPLLVTNRGESVWGKSTRSERRIRILEKKGYTSSSSGMGSNNKLYEITKAGIQALAAYDHHYLMYSNAKYSV